jgi:hypothetical protein
VCGRGRPWEEFGKPVGAELHGPVVVVVDLSVVVAAEEDEVVEVGGSAVGQVFEVVGVAPVKRFICHITGGLY